MKLRIFIALSLVFVMGHQLKVRAEDNEVPRILSRMDSIMKNIQEREKPLSKLQQTRILRHLDHLEGVFFGAEKYGGWVTDAVIERADVHVAGVSRDSLYRNCLKIYKEHGLRKVNEITIKGGARMYNSSPHWNREATCGILTLNAHLPEANLKRHHIKIEDAVLNVQSTDPLEVIMLVRKYMPHVVGSSKVNQIRIGTKSVYTPDAYMSAAVIVAIIESNYDLKLGSLFSAGTIESTPYIFSGRAKEDIEVECLKFVKTVFKHRNVNQVRVHSVSRYSGGVYWNYKQICGIISALSKER